MSSQILSAHSGENETAKALYIHGKSYFICEYQTCHSTCHNTAVGQSVYLPCRYDFRFAFA